MTDDLEDLKSRLVVGRKSDGRSVYDEKAKAELVVLCRQPGAPVSRLARECGVNANQVGRWLREHGHERRQRSTADGIAPTPAAFVAVPVVAGPAAPVEGAGAAPLTMSLQASLPNGVTMDLRSVEPRHIGEVIGALGRLRCSVSTKA